MSDQLFFLTIYVRGCATMQRESREVLAAISRGDA